MAANNDDGDSDGDGDAVEDDIGNADAGTKLHLRVDAQSTSLPHSQP